MDDFIHTIEEDDNVSLAESSDDEQEAVEQAQPEAATEQAKAGKAGKAGKTGKKQKQKNAKKAPQSKRGQGRARSSSIELAAPMTGLGSVPARSSQFKARSGAASGGRRGGGGGGGASSGRASKATGWDFAGALETVKERHQDRDNIVQSLQEKINSKRLHLKRPDTKPGDTKQDDSDEEMESSSGSDDDDDDSASDDSASSSGGGAGGGAGAAADTMRPLGRRATAAEGEDEAENARQAEYFEAEPEREGGQDEATSFASLHLSRALLKAVSDLGYNEPTPIQKRSIPLILAGRDVCGSAATGSGKTAAFLLPALERLLYRPKHIAATRVLIVTPTRELATQIYSMFQQLAKYSDIRGALVVGGLSLKVQEAELRGRPDIVVCTPGRIVDLLTNSPSVHMDDLDILILDEADRLLEMGFTDEVLEIVRHCPVGRQSLLFSATMVSKVEELINLSLKKPVRVSADVVYDMTSRLTQEFVRIRPNREDDREAMLLALCVRSFHKETIVFCNTKQTAHRLTILLGLAGLSCGELHGNLTQRQRLETLDAFRHARIKFVVATDLAGRGLDIRGVSTVINFEMPRDQKTYVHRVGRTARAGRTGRAVTLTGERGRALMRQIVKHSTSNVKSRQIPADAIEHWREKIDEFEPHLRDILHEERMEKELRIAEMEAMKAANIMENYKEIASRPARTWFQTAAQKAAVKRAALAALQSGEGSMDAAALDKKLDEKIEARAEAAKTKKELKKEKAAKAQAEKDAAKKRPHRLTRKKRRRREMEAEDAKVLAQAERQASNDASVAALAVRVGKGMKAQALQHSKAKAAKLAARTEAAERGVPQTRVEKEAVASQRQGKQKSKKVKATGFEVEATGGRGRKGAAVSKAPRDDWEDGEERSSSGSNKKQRRAMPRYAPEPVDREAIAAARGAGRFEFKEHDRDAPKLRRHAKPTKKGFKSKARYKRR